MPAQEEPSDHGKISCEEIVVSKKVKLHWKFENCTEKLDINARRYKSPVFCIEDNDKKLTKWRLKIVSFHQNTPTPPTSWILTAIFSLNQEPVQADVSIYVLDNHKEPNFKSETSMTFSKESTKYYTRIPMEEIKEQSGNRKFIIDNVLSVVCELTFKKPVLSDAAEKNDLALAADFGAAFANKTFTDCKLVCQGEQFEANMFVLGARSPVFRAMFSNDCKEATSKEVKMDHLAPKVVRDMLHYMYTGKAPNLEETAPDLIEAAEQYQLDPLKDKCEEKLMNAINNDNALDLLVIGDRYNAKDLKAEAKSYLAENMATLLKEQNWKARLANYPTLLIEVMEDMVNKDSKDSDGLTPSQARKRPKLSHTGAPPSEAGGRSSSIIIYN